VNAAQRAAVRRLEELLDERATVQRCLNVCALHAPLLRHGSFQPQAEVQAQLKALADAIAALGTDAYLHMQGTESWNVAPKSDLERYARALALHYVRERAQTPYYTDLRGVARLARAQFGRDAAAFADSVGIAISSTRTSDFVELLDAMIGFMGLDMDPHRLARDVVARWTGEALPEPESLADIIRQLDR
jgi:hypothetical protein